MILLLGGTSETAALAMALAHAGQDVLVSTATDIRLDTGNHPRIRRRIGMLDTERMIKTAGESRVRLIVDALHPYAELARSTAWQVAARLGIPYLSWLRPSSLTPEDGVIFGQDHETAAGLACSFGHTVFLTTGSRRLVPYVHAAERANVDLVVRVLPYSESLKACLDTGIPPNQIVTGRGPFSVEDNLSVLQRFQIGVLVTKDSGHAGGLPAKLEAARVHGCPVVVVQRPSVPMEGAYSDPEQLLKAAVTLLQPETASTSRGNEGP